jgi:alpha-L-fucosidase
MNTNGKAIYNTRATKNYQDGNTWFTESKDGKTRFALVCLPEGKPASTTIEWEGNVPAKGSRLTLLQTGKSVKWQKAGNKVKVWLPADIASKKLPALAFSMTGV